MNWDTATISVVTSATVAILSLGLPLLFNFINDRAKWNRERKAAETEKIDKATNELLDSLSLFRSADAGDYDADSKQFKEDYRKLLSKYYVWERAVWPKCSKIERMKLKSLRESIEAGGGLNVHTEGRDFADVILSISYAVAERM